METRAQAQLTVMPTLETNAAPTGFRWKWLLYLGAVIVLLAAAKYFNVLELLKQALGWVLPGTVMYVYLGSLANVSATQRARTPAEWALYGVGLLATVVVTIFVTRIAKQALSKKIKA